MTDFTSAELRQLWQMANEDTELSGVVRTYMDYEGLNYD